MDETDGAKVAAAVTDGPQKVTRARMVIEFADGSARYFEAREPGIADIKVDTSQDVRRRVFGDGFMPAGPGMLVADLTRRWGYQIEGVTLRLTYNPDYHLTIEQDSGEIPPELAERAVADIDALPPAQIALDELRPYLARIAGKP